MLIRVLSPADVGPYRTVRLAALSEQPPAFGTLAEIEVSLPLEALASRLRESKDSFFLGDFVGHALVGTIRFSRFEAPNEKHRAAIGGFYVDPNFRRRGIARALAAEVLHRARRDPDLRRIHLTVVTTQNAAIALYQSLRFSIYATEREAFSKGGQFHDEHLMELLFDES